MPSGPRPLHPSVRQRQNKTSTAAVLELVGPEERLAIAVPELPADRLWDPRTSQWWNELWREPMRLEWLPSDSAGALVAAYLLDEFFKVAGADTVDHKVLVALSKGFTDRMVRLGGDPFARRSLQWLLVQTERDEAARDLTKERTVASREKRAPKRRGLDALG